MIILENTDQSLAVDQPYLSELGGQGAVLTNYHALTHPSQPNYIALVAGSAYGVTDDTPVTIDVKHLGDLIEARGLTWKLYAENYPGNCYLGFAAGSISGGQYVRHHMPFLEFLDVQNDRSRFASGALPSFALYIPNNQHNGHDSNVTIADQWLESRFEPLLTDPRFIADTLFIVTFDESRSNTDSAVFTTLFGPSVIAGAISTHNYNHYSLLRTIEDILALGTLGRHDAAAEPITSIWK